MKPTWAQYFFARDWPLKIWLTVIPLLCVAAVVRSCDPTASMWSDWAAVLWFAGAAVLGLLVGLLLAGLSALFFLGPIYYHRGLKNGAPFRPGDRVRILVGPYKDRVAYVYDLWQGDSVRVDLGEDAKQRFKDIFSTTQLLREQSPDRSTSERAANPLSESDAAGGSAEN